MFWLRNKKNNFQVHTLIWRPEKQNINPLYSDEFSHTDKSIKWDCPLYILRGHKLTFPNYDIFLFLKRNLNSTLKAQDLLEKLAEILLYNFQREHILLKLKIKKLLRKISSKNLTAGV